jgi:Nif-specific regulatory protein
MLGRRYKITEEIGAGNAGKVLKAVDLLNGDTVAIKVLLRQEPEFVSLFKNEFQLLKKLHHPNLLRVYDFGFSRNREPYFSMEYLPAQPWEEFLRPLDFDRLYWLMLEILSALDFLHCKKIVHGDIKPSNILISPSPAGQFYVKFTDFGFAEHEKVEDPTRWKGTLPYLAPEIIRGEGYTTQADLYSVGVLIYESLFGKPPFDDVDPMKLAKSHLVKEVVIPREPSLPEELRNIILKLLEKDPIDRFFSAGEIIPLIRQLSGIKPANQESVLVQSLIRSSGFVDRDKELSLLKDILNGVMDEGNRIVMIAGKSGTGKSRLLQEFSAQSQVEGFPVINLTPEKIPSPEIQKKRILEFIELDSPPAILIWDNSPKTADSGWELLSLLIQDRPDKKFLICLTSTVNLPPLEENRKSMEMENKIRSICGNALQVIDLDNLNQTGTRKLLDAMFDWKEDTDRLSAVVQEETGGNPLYIIRLLNQLAEEGKIARTKQLWSLEPQSIEESSLPPEIKSELENRAADLDHSSVELLRCASVWGREMDQDQLAQMSGFTEEDLLTRLKDALVAGLVESLSEPDKNGIRFVDNLTRRFFYEMIDPERKKTLHRKAGEILEKSYQTDVGEHVFELADHFYRAEDAEPATRYSLLAARKAECQLSRRLAITHYARVLELTGRAPSLSPVPREELLESLADQYELIGEQQKSLQLYEKALTNRARDAADICGVALLYKKMGKVCDMMGLHDRAITYLEESLERFKVSGSWKEAAAARIELGWVHFRTSDYPRAREYFEGVLKDLQKEITTRELASVFSALGSINWAGGNYPEAERYYLSGLEVSQQMGDRQKIADSHANLGLVARSRGNFTQAIAHFKKSLELLKELKNQYRLSIGFNNLGLIYLDENSWDKALEYLRKAIELQEKSDDQIGLALSLNNIGLIHRKRGELSWAGDFFNRSLALFLSCRHRAGLALVYYNLGNLHSNREDWDRALWYHRNSLKIRKELGEEAGIADCLAMLGEMALYRSDFDRAKAYLTEAQSLYQKQGKRKSEAEVSLNLAEWHIRTGDLEQAQTHLERVREFLYDNDIKFFLASYLRTCAILEKAKEAYRDAEQFLSESARIFRQIQARLELGRTYLETGLLKAQLGRYKEAKAFLAESLNIYGKAQVHAKKKEVESLLERMKDTMMAENERIATFYQLSDLLNNIWDPDELLTRSLKLTIELLNAERGAIIFYSDKDKSFEVKVTQGIEQETSDDAIAISRQVLKDVVRNDSPLIVEDARKDPRFANRQSVIIHNILSILCVPLRTRNRLIGTVYLDHRGLPAIFSSEDVDFLKAFANLIAIAIEKSELYAQANEQIFQLKEALHRTIEYPGIVGKSPQMNEVFNTVEKVAYSKASVMILGENGTGKELIANLIHSRSPRKDGPFIKVNCAALVESLLESELFGIEERTATGVGFRKGKFELADGGTIFLDEIGDMSLTVQAKVLRVMQEREFERVGGHKTISVDIRVISATNMDLEQKMEERLFRKDLYFRLNPIVINVPPLRERKEDIPLLMEYYMEKLSKEYRKPPVKISRRIVDLLTNYNWPGNVRELQQKIESAILLSEDGSFPEKLLPKEALKTKSLVSLDKYGTLKDILEWVEKKKIQYTLEKCGWNQTKAAKELGITEPTLRRRMKYYRIKKAIKFPS